MFSLKNIFLYITGAITFLFLYIITIVIITIKESEQQQVNSIATENLLEDAWQQSRAMATTQNKTTYTLILDIEKYSK